MYDWRQHAKYMYCVTITTYSAGAGTYMYLGTVQSVHAF